MEQIRQLLEKMNALAANNTNGAIETDLMMDHTRRLYELLLEHKHATPTNEITVEPAEDIIPAPAAIVAPAPPPVEKKQEPLLFEMPPTSAEETIIDAPLPANNNNGDIRTRIGINDKYQVIAELFGNDTPAYEQAIDAINAATDMQQALLWLDNNAYEKYNWDVESEAVQIFYSTLTGFFSDN